MKHTNRLVNMAIETCADSVFELRKCDVERALETAKQNGSLADTAAFIGVKRPEFAHMCVEIIADFEV